MSLSLTSELDSWSTVRSGVMSELVRLTPCLAHCAVTCPVFWQRFPVSLYKWKLQGLDSPSQLKVLSVSAPLPALVRVWPIRFPSTTGSSESVGCGTYSKSTFPRNCHPLPILIILHYPGPTLNSLDLREAIPSQQAGLCWVTLRVMLKQVRINKGSGMYRRESTQFCML